MGTSGAAVPASCEDCGNAAESAEPGAGVQCPSCGRVFGGDGEDGAAEAPVPWHFTLLVVATVLYLLFRAYQGVVWLLGRL